MNFQETILNYGRLVDQFTADDLTEMMTAQQARGACRKLVREKQLKIVRTGIPGRVEPVATIYALITKRKLEPSHLGCYE